MDNPREVNLNPRAALAWSLLSPGLGQRYNGQVGKAVVMGLLPVVALFAVQVTWWGGSCLGWIAGEVIVVHVGVAYEAFLSARRLRWAPQRFYRHGAFLALLGAGLLLAGPALPVHVGSGPMLVDRWYYRKNTPRQGDLVMVDGSAERILGVAGDHLVAKEGHLWRNGQEIRESVQGRLDHTVAGDSVYVPRREVPLSRLEGRVMFFRRD